MSNSPAPRSARPRDLYVDILGVRVSAIDMSDAVGSLHHWVTNGQAQYVCVTGVHGIMESQSDAALMAIHNASGMTTPDGVPLVWLGRRAGATWMSRVYGPDLMLAACKQGLADGWRHYFYGGAPGVAQLLADRLQKRFPTLQVAGTYTPPFRELTQAESAEVISAINASDADVVWVGLSTPKQERFMAAHIGGMDRAVMVGVGAAFDIHAGLLKQAPQPIQRAGMEWAFRLAVEPRRLWKRYAKNNPAFIRAVLKHKPVLVRRPRDLTRGSTSGP